MIHEFDPYFNYRTTKYLADEGFYDFHNWFDDRAWYPLGRIIGGTIYPGLMVTSATIYHFLQALNLTIDVRNVCVFLAPLFSSFTTIVTYLLTSELHSTVSFDYLIFGLIERFKYNTLSIHDLTINILSILGCWSRSRFYDCYCSRLHISFSGRFI